MKIEYDECEQPNYIHGMKLYMVKVIGFNKSKFPQCYGYFDAFNAIEILEFVSVPSNLEIISVPRLSMCS